MRAAAPDSGPGQARRDRRARMRGRAPGVRTRKRAAPPPERRRGPSRRCRLRGAALHGDAEGARLVDEVLGDAAAGERDDALRQEVQQFVVAAAKVVYEKYVNEG